jgi:hypothetical protein
MALADMARSHRVGAYLSLPAGVDAHAALFGEDRAAVLCAVSADHVNDVVNACAAVPGLACDVVGAVGGATLTLTPDAVLDLRALFEHDDTVVPKIAAGRPT